MFLGSYKFDGDPDELVSAYERLVSSIPAEAFEVHLCVVRENGLTVYDTCPTRQVFEQFSTSPEFARLVAAAGLPTPQVTALGAVHNLLGSAVKTTIA